MARPNQALRFHGASKFWKDNNPEKGGLDIGQVLDNFTKLQGVACDGAINGLSFGTLENLRGTFETINSVDTFVLRDCSTGSIVFQINSSTDPQASARVYRATLTGANGSVTGSPTIQGNTLSGTPVFAYVGEGVYTLTLSSAFTANKTNVQLANLTATGGVILKAAYTSTSVITISTFAVDGTTPADFIGTLSISVTVDV